MPAVYWNISDGASEGVRAIDQGCRQAPEGQDLPAWQELAAASERFAKAAMRVIGEVVTMPNASDLASRLLEAVGVVAAIVMDGQRATAQREVEELRELVQLKSDFLRLTTHELRRPLGLLSGYLSLIREGTFGTMPDDLQVGMQKIEVGTRQMASLVEGLAVLARLEDRGEVLRRQPTRIGNLLADAIDEVMPEAQVKQITIERRLPEPDILARTDRHHLRIAVVNLLTNAIKYTTDASRVKVALTADNELITILVSDQGPGIEPADTERVFDRWHRGSDVEAPGLGLGLYIVKMIVETHGGRVSLESTPGQGSTFMIRLPR